jgi:hypothetical protein
MTTKTITVKITFDAENCADVDAENYDPEMDLESILGFGVDCYNVTDWEILEETAPR